MSDRFEDYYDGGRLVRVPNTVVPIQDNGVDVAVTCEEHGESYHPDHHCEQCHLMTDPATVMTNPTPRGLHHHEPWQVRDDGAGPYCAACGQPVPADTRTDTDLTQHSFDIIVTRSAGTDGAIVVFIDGTFGTDGQAPLRIIVNDEDVYVPVPFEYDPTTNDDREAGAVHFTIQPHQIGYTDGR